MTQSILNFFLSQLREAGILHQTRTIAVGNLVQVNSPFLSRPETISVDRDFAPSFFQCFSFSSCPVIFVGLDAAAGELVVISFFNADEDYLILVFRNQ